MVTDLLFLEHCVKAVRVLCSKLSRGMGQDAALPLSFVVYYGVVYFIRM